MHPSTINRRLSGIDAAFLYLERPEIPLHIAGLCVFDGEVPFAGFVRSIDSRLHLLPRYRQIVADPPLHIGYPSWEDDRHFDIRRHIFHATVEPPGRREDLESLVSRILSHVMDRGKPLWDMHVIDGLEGGQGAILVRIHHSLADGIAGASIINMMLDETPDPPRPPRKRRFRPRPAPVENHCVADVLAGAIRSSLESMIDAQAVLLELSDGLVKGGLKDAVEKLLGLAPEFTASSERFVFNKPCSGERKFCWMDFPLDAVKSIRQAAGGTVNDVILTVVARGVARYLHAHREPVKGRFLRVVCPVNVRRDNGETLGNRITFLPVALPLDIEDPVRLLGAVAERTAIMKKARAAHLVTLLANWLGAAPPPLQALFWQAIPNVPLPVPLLHMICTNVPGSPTPLYAGGRRMLACYPHVPTGYELGVNCAFQSYDGRFFCGLTADAVAVSDVGLLRDLMHRALDELKRATEPKPAKRKPPRPLTPPAPEATPPEVPPRAAAAAAD